MSQQYQKQKLKWKEQGRKEMKDEIIELMNKRLKELDTDLTVWNYEHETEEELIKLIKQIKEKEQ